MKFTFTQTSLQDVCFINLECYFRGEEELHSGANDHLKLQPSGLTVAAGTLLFFHPGMQTHKPGTIALLMNVL